jgi:NADH dehydrogenase
MKKILVLGGTGFVGRHLCEKLTHQGIRVTLPTRKPENARHVQSLPLVDVMVANVHVESELVALMAGVDAVVNLVAILHGSQADFTRAHVTLPQTIARACQVTGAKGAKGVKRVVHVSALGAALDAPSMYQRSKAQGEQVLQAAGLDLTLLRPSVIFGAEDKFLNVFAKLQQIFPVIPLAGAGTKFQPVWVEDVAQAIVNCLLQPTTAGHIYDVCGPDVFTLAQLVQLAGRVSGANHGQGRPVFPLPLALGRLQATLMSLAPGEPLMSRDNLDSMAVDNVSSGQQPGLSALGITASSLAGVAPSYLSIASKRSVFQNLRARAGRG